MFWRRQRHCNLMVSLQELNGNTWIRATNKTPLTHRLQPLLGHFQEHLFKLRLLTSTSLLRNSWRRDYRLFVFESPIPLLQLEVELSN